MRYIESKNLVLNMLSQVYVSILTLLLFSISVSDCRRNPYPSDVEFFQNQSRKKSIITTSFWHALGDATINAVQREKKWIRIMKNLKKAVNHFTVYQIDI